MNALQALSLNVPVKDLMSNHFLASLQSEGYIYFNVDLHKNTRIVPLFQEEVHRTRTQGFREFPRGDETCNCLSIVQASRKLVQRQRSDYYGIQALKIFKSKHHTNATIRLIRVIGYCKSFISNCSNPKAKRKSAVLSIQDID